MAGIPDEVLNLFAWDGVPGPSAGPGALPRVEEDSN